MPAAAGFSDPNAKVRACNVPNCPNVHQKLHLCYASDCDNPIHNLCAKNHGLAWTCGKGDCLASPPGPSTHFTHPTSTSSNDDSSQEDSPSLLTTPQALMTITQPHMTATRGLPLPTKELTAQKKARILANL